MTAPAGGRWSDLQARVISATVMTLVGAVDIWLGGLPFTALVVGLTGLMIWELSRMIRPDRARDAVILGGGAVAALVMAVTVDAVAARLALLVVPVALLFFKTPDRWLFALYAGLVMLAGYGLVSLRDIAGTAAIVWLILVVIASDVMGYFAGRSLGGPKFWPAISPKKTWSGTLAGWAGATVVGLGFVLVTNAGWGLLILSPVVAFAGQLGDIAESWIKRRTGVKDSSALIPGHGGVLDRFDALIGATIAVLALGLILPLPLPAGN